MKSVRFVPSFFLSAWKTKICQYQIKTTVPIIDVYSFNQLRCYLVVDCPCYLDYDNMHGLYLRGHERFFVCILRFPTYQNNNIVVIRLIRHQYLRTNNNFVFK